MCIIPSFRSEELAVTKNKKRENKKPESLKLIVSEQLLVETPV